MSEHWIGKAVSIHCVDDIGVFQGTIKDANSSKIVITRAFRNGLPIKSLDTEVTIMASDIVKIDLIPSHNSTNIHNGYHGNTTEHFVNPNRDEYPAGNSNYVKDVKPSRRSPSNNNSQRHMKVATKSPPTVKNVFANFIPSKIELKLGHLVTSTAIATANGGAGSSNNFNQGRITNVPVNNGANSYGNGTSNGKFNGASAQAVPLHKNDKKKQNRNAFNKNTFATPSDDPAMDEDFDFEKNLALFNKQAIWDEIDAIQKPDLVRQTGHVKKKNYRHDENILDSKPVGSRQIKMKYSCSEEYVTDEGILIPTLTVALRSRILLQAELVGLVWERQCDMLSRSTVELALQLLGGARRLSLKNQHQWPKIAIICDELFRDRHSDIGFSTGRQLASQGLKVYVYVTPSPNSDQKTNKELDLFKATGNEVTYTVDELPSCDLVVLATQNNIRNPNVIKWINDSRSPVMAVDPPPCGISDLNIKCSILPLLPLENISSSCGKLYLCNLSIPDSIYRDAGITYKSPFGHKFIIPLHLINDNVSSEPQ